MWPILVSVSGSEPLGQEEASKVKPGQGLSGSTSHYCSAIRHKWGVVGDGL